MVLRVFTFNPIHFDIQTDFFLRLLLVFIMPIGIGNIGWKMYMINGGWDCCTFIIIVCDSSFVSLHQKKRLGGRTKMYIE